MNLLLLLSALLSALTGVGANVRAPERAQAVAAVSIGRVVAAIAPAHAMNRPMQGLPALAAVTLPGVHVATAVVRLIPRWIDRRRE